MDFQTLVAEQRAYFLTGKPASVEHRLTQLKTLRKVLLDNQESICDAVGKDLGRSNEWTYALELSLLYVELDYFIANVKVRQLFNQKYFCDQLRLGNIRN